MADLSPAKQEAHFRATAPQYMHLLMTDFPALSVEDSAAVFGNFGWESKGLTDDQEDRPVVKGSRGGLNWAQWTGPRRRAMEAYCKRNKLDPTSDVAAYKWLWNELKTTEKKAIAAVTKAVGLEAKVKAFELAFLRAGATTKHYDGRNRWAVIALDAYNDAYPDGAEPAAPEVAEDEPSAPVPAEPEVLPPLPAPAPVHTGSRPGWLAIVVIGVLAAGVAYVLNQWGGNVAEDINTDNAVSLFGESDGFRDVWRDIATQAALAFVLPIIGAVATTAVGWIGAQWMRLFKVEFDAKSSATLHDAFERAMLAAIEQFGPKANKAALISSAADYMATFNPDAAQRLGRERLEALAIPHLATAQATYLSVNKNLRG